MKKVKHTLSFRFSGRVPGESRSQQRSAGNLRGAALHRQPVPDRRPQVRPQSLRARHIRKSVWNPFTQQCDGVIVLAVSGTGTGIRTEIWTSGLYGFM